MQWQVRGFDFPTLSDGIALFDAAVDYVQIQYRRIGDQSTVGRSFWYNLPVGSEGFGNLLLYPIDEDGAISVVWSFGADQRDPGAKPCDVDGVPSQCLSEGLYDLRILSSFQRMYTPTDRATPETQLAVSTTPLKLLFTDAHR